MGQLRERLIQTMELRRYSPKTIRSYVWAVKSLVLHYMISPDKISSKQVQDFLFAMLKVKNWSWNTLHTAVYGLKFFYHDFLGRPKPQFYIPVPKSSKRLPVIWSPQELEVLFGLAPDLQIETSFKIAYGAGLRISEVARLKVGDIDSGHMTIWVRQGKGQIDRGALLTPTLLSQLRLYWREYQPEEWLFPCKKDPSKHMRPGQFRYQFKKVKKQAGFNKECGPHSLRHSFATHLIASGVDVHRVQKLLGHKSVVTTMIYIHLSQTMIMSKAAELDLLQLKPLNEN